MVMRNAVMGADQLGGEVTLQIVRKDGWMPEDLVAKLRGWEPRTNLGRTIRNVLPYVPREYAHELLDGILQVGVIESELSLKVLRADASRFRMGGVVEDYGVVCRRLVTDAFVAAVVDALDVGVGFTLSNFRYHGIGTGTTAEAAAQTALVTELTTEYGNSNTRATGTATQPSANIYTSTATNTLDSGTPVLREHAVFSASTVGTMLDRSLFAAITLDGSVGDALQSAYSITFTSGG